MRCLPDSLDYVVLTRAASMNANDREDMKLMHRMGTKVLYGLQLSDLLVATASQEEALDSVVSMTENEGLDGWYLKADAMLDDEPAREFLIKVVDCLLAAKGDRTLFFEGELALLDDVRLGRMDYVVLSTRYDEYEFDARARIIEALRRISAAERLLLSSEITVRMMDAELLEVDAPGLISDLVLSEGPLGGMVLYGISKDYYSSEGNYMQTESLIEKLNPSK